MFTGLTASEIATEYHRTERWRRPNSAAELVQDVHRYMAGKGLAGSTISRFDIARHVLDLQAAPEPTAPVETPEQAAWQADMTEGTTDAGRRQVDELALAGQVAGMSMSEYSRNRARLGVHKGMLDFLAGN